MPVFLWGPRRVIVFTQSFLFRPVFRSTKPQLIKNVFGRVDCRCTLGFFTFSDDVAGRTSVKRALQPCKPKRASLSLLRAYI